MDTTISNKEFILRIEANNSNKRVSNLEEAREEKANDLRASKFIDSNKVNSTDSILPAISTASNKTKQNHTALIVCALSGITSTMATPFPYKEILTHSYPLNAFYRVLTLTESALYESSETVLAGTILAVYKDKGLLRSYNKNAGMDNLLLATAGKYVLVEAIKALNFLVVNNIDVDTLPKLDISYETHSDSIKTFEQPLTNYLAILREEALASKEMAHLRLVRDAETKRIADELAREKRNSKEIKLVETAYEIKRKEAKEALKTVALDLISMKHKRLTEILVTATASKTGAELMSTEIKTKIVLRLDELISNGTDTTYLKDLRLIKDFIVLANSSRVEARKDSALERVTDSVIVDKKAKLMAMLKKARGE